MSADNWAICPRCLDKAQRHLVTKKQAAAEAYGKVSIEEFEKRRARLKPIQPDDYRTFREDYEFYGAESGEITASYGGHCSECGLEVTFEEKRRFYRSEP